LGGWRFVEIDASLPGGWLGFGPRIVPGYLDYTRGSLSAKGR
jgi:hypothetical protein